MTLEIIEKTVQSESFPALYLELMIINTENLGQGCKRTNCKIQDFELVRIEQVIYGQIISGGAIWRIGSGTIINNDKVVEYLENAYKIHSER